MKTTLHSEYTEIVANVTIDGSITNSSGYRCRYIQVYKGFSYVINAEKVSDIAVRIAFFDEKPKVGLTGEFIKEIGGDIKNYTYLCSDLAEYMSLTDKNHPSIRK